MAYAFSAGGGWVMGLRTKNGCVVLVKTRQQKKPQKLSYTWYGEVFHRECL